MPAVDAWRRSARRREWGRKAFVAVIAVPAAVVGLAIAVAAGPSGLTAFGALLAAWGAALAAYGFRRARWERVARIVLRWDRPRVVPRRTHWNGGALALHWREIVARAEALGVANPEAFLAVASDREPWFPVHEGLTVFGALANGCLPGAPEQADLARLVDVLGAEELAGTGAEEPPRFRLEYVDASDGRSDDELFASGYCVAHPDDLQEKKP